MLASTLVQVAAADHAEAFAVLLAQDLYRQLEQDIGDCDVIHFDTFPVGNDIIVVIAAEGRNDNMVEGELILSLEVLQAPVTGVIEREGGSILKVHNACPVVDSSLDRYRGSQIKATDI